MNPKTFEMRGKRLRGRLLPVDAARLRERMRREPHRINASAVAQATQLKPFGRDRETLLVCGAALCHSLLLRRPAAASMPSTGVVSGILIARPDLAVDLPLRLVPDAFRNVKGVSRRVL